jgi:hypothetical protein
MSEPSQQSQMMMKGSDVSNEEGRDDTTEDGQHG